MKFDGNFCANICYVLLFRPGRKVVLFYLMRCVMTLVIRPESSRHLDLNGTVKVTILPSLKNVSKEAGNKDDLPVSQKSFTNISIFR